MTVTYTPSQLGIEVAAFWVDSSPNFTVSNVVTASGIQFTVPAPDRLRYRSLALSLTRTAGVSTTGTLTVGLVNNVAAPVFSAAFLPASQTLIPLYSGTRTFTTGTYSISLNLGVSTPPTSPFVGGSLEVAGQVLDHSSFAGNLALVATYTGATTTFSTASLVGDAVPFLSGLPSTKRKQSRADWCPRCGRPLFRQELIEDGFTKTLVCPECWDRSEQRYPPYKPPEETNP